jgi:hypothetical protein
MSDVVVNTVSDRPYELEESPRKSPYQPQVESDRYDDQIRELTIIQLNRGYVAHVGCHKFAFSSKEELIGKIIQYINEPAKTEAEWFKGELFKY